MTKAFEDMLYLLGAGARGFDVSSKDMDMAKIRECAISQGVWPMVYKAAEKTTDVSMWRPEFFLAVANSVSRRNFSLETVKELEKNGIEYCLLKGIAVSSLYAMPDCRISGDMDIYINPRQEGKVKKILEEKGYTVSSRAVNDHHLKARHKIGGLLEVHVRMYSKISEKIVFGGHISYSNEYDKISVDGKEYYTLNTYDTLVYLTAHYIKHLVSGGCGIRQIMDLLLFMEKNKERIDFDKYNELMKKLKYDKLIEVIKSIGAVYFGFDYPVCHKELVDKLLTDTENGGTFGYLADDRTDFYEMYCASRTSSKAGNKIYMAFNNEETIFMKLFPLKKGLMQRGYEYAKYPVLIPFAWVHRWVDLIIRKKKEKNINAIKNEKAKKRLEMMKELEMID